MMMDGMGWMMMMMMGLVIAIFLGFVIGGGYVLFRAIRGDDRRSAGRVDDARTTSSATAILEERFARGEIDRDEFEERRRTLDRP